MKGNSMPNINSQLDQGPIDIVVVTTREFYRERCAAYTGHHPMLAYQCIAVNESLRRQWYNTMQKMLLPCGLPRERHEG